MTAAAPRMPFWRWMVFIALALALSAAGSLFAEPRLLEAWLLAFVCLIGLSAGSLGLLMIGHILGDEWLNPVRDELEAASLTLPFVALLAAPLALGLESLYPWANGSSGGLPPARQAYLQPEFFLGRGAFYLICWTALAFWIARAGRRRRASAVGLAILAPTFGLAAVDWVMSREPWFWSTIFAFAFSLSQLLAALAGAIAITLLRPGRPGAETLQSVERALLTLALLVLWVWFAQFLIIWLANLPEEAAWYLARSEWTWLKIGIVIPSLLAAILVMLPPREGRWSMLAASALLLVQHAGHMVWLIRPPAQEVSLPALDAVVLAALGGAWALWLWAGLRGQPNLGEPAEGAEAKA